MLAKKGSFHFCEENSQDCQETRKGKGKAMHLENFREITQKEVDNQVPGWAFEGSPNKIFEAYLKRATLTGTAHGKGEWFTLAKAAEKEEQEEGQSPREGFTCQRKGSEEEKKDVNS